MDSKISIPEVKDFPKEKTWIPSTPAKPSFLICESGQGNQLAQEASLELQSVSQECSVSEMGQLKSRGLLQSNEDHSLTGDCVKNVLTDGGFDKSEAAAPANANSQTHAEAMNVRDILCTGDTEKLSNMKFVDILALADAAGGTGAAGNAAAKEAFNALCFSKMSGGSSICSSIPFNQNPPPGIVDVTSSSNSSSPFTPRTPDQTKTKDGGQVSDELNLNNNDRQILIPRDAQENSEENKLEKKEVSELVKEPENHKPDYGDSPGSKLNKTPQQKPRRKKHRPRVVIEGKPNRTYKPRTPKNSGVEETQTVKRKYVRRKEVNNPAAAPSDDGSNVINSETKPPSSNETPTSKRKCVRRRGGKKPAVTPSDMDSNALDPETKSPDSNETPKCKRKNVRRKGVNHSAGTPSDEGSNAIDSETKSPGSNETPKCRRKCVRRKGVNNSAGTPSDEGSNAIDSETKSPGSNETPKCKRKCVRRKGVSNSSGTPSDEGSNAIDPETKSPGSNETPKSKRKNILRKVVNKFAGTPSDEGSNVTDPETKSNSSNETPTGKRKYVQRNQVNKSPIDQTEKGSCGTIEPKTVSHPRRSCRRHLKFQFEELVTDDNSTQPSSNIDDPDVQKFCKQDQSMPTIQLGQHREANEELHELRTAYSQPERHTPEPSTPSKTDSTYDNKSMDWNTSGECKILLSNGTHDKEKNLPDMTEYTEAQHATQNANSFNCSSSALLTEEMQVRVSKIQQSCLAKEVLLFSKIDGEIRYDSLQAYPAILPLERNDIDRTSEIHFPILSKKGTEKEHKTISSQCDARGVITSNVTSKSAQNLQQLKYLPTSVDSGRLKRKRSAGLPQVHDLALMHVREVTSGFGQTFSLPHHSDHTSNKALATDTSPKITKKKARNKVNGAEAPNIYAQHQSISTANGLNINAVDEIDQIVEQFNHLNINAESNAMVLHQLDGTIVPFEGAFGQIRKRQPRAKVELDDETTRVWMLLMQDINSEGIHRTDETKAKWWEGERQVFHGRVESFIARMRLVQGDRRFSPWKGSVVDSVVGVFLTQNVSDHLSSSAFMALAAKFPLKSSRSAKLDEGRTSIIIEEPESYQIEDSGINVEPQIDIEERNFNLKVEQDGPVTLEIQDITEQPSISVDSLKSDHGSMESNLDGQNNQLGNIVDRTSTNPSNAKRRRPGKGKQNEVHWESLRQQAQANGKKRERTVNTMDTVDWEAVRLADVGEVAESIKERGMHNVLAERIKNFLNRLVREHGSIDLEWLRDIPPDKAKEYLLSFKGLGLKSVECVRLLTLHHLAFPVDTNVGRIAVRLGWVPLQPLPESLQLHLLEMYPILESIQKYLWPRLCKLDQETLYELHYHMITFGKVFCTKSKPNCNACPLRGECRHFASAFASARLTLPAPEEKGIVSIMESRAAEHNPICASNPLQLPLPQTAEESEAQSGGSYSQPIIEEPATPEPIVEEPTTPEVEKLPLEIDIEDTYGDDPDEIPKIDLNMTQFVQNLKMFVENNMELTQAEMSKALITLTPQAASIPTPKLKHISRLKTEHYVYELPDSHPLLKELDKREPDDPCSYLLAIWTPGETANSVQPPERHCSSQESGELCNKETCFACNCIQEAHSQTVRGTLLIPCRTAMRGSFPLNGTYFQVNEVFADHESSLKPIDVPRDWLWNLPRKTVFFGTSIPTIFKGLSTKEIQYCFREGYVCVRGFDQKARAPRPLIARLHFPASKLAKTKGKADETGHEHSH
ncbi:PREDICTED: protein ROS1-like [Ipomoea nil]|uniref:protein ROS1-like n=1 Tax=Ipomoea nil TaxID=35883 RepID=UPI0009015DC1|nr:PREDICTED: protein ROS1-like [Ipomoea nil]